MRNFIILCLALAAVVNAKEYTRCVSLSPAVTEMICAIGAEKQLVARSRFCDYPQSVKCLPVAGELGIPQTEKILSLKADLVVTDITNPQSDWSILKRAGVRVVVLKSDSIGDYRRNITALGELLGRESAAASECRRFYSELKKASAGDSKKTVSALLLLGINPLVSCSKNTFADEVLTCAGIRSITRDFSRKYFVLSAEYVIEKNPDAVILTGMSGDFRKYLYSIEAWKNLAFIKNNAIIDDIPQELLCRLSPRTPEAVKALKNAVAFPDSQARSAK